LAARERELLNTSYFHVVFTLPHELNVLALENPRLFYDLLTATCYEIGTDISRIDRSHKCWHTQATHPCTAALTHFRRARTTGSLSEIIPAIFFGNRKFHGDRAARVIIDND
jgi:hypothetical protein